MVCVKIPQEHREFLESNPRLAQMVGNTVTHLIEIYSKVEGLKELVRRPELLASLIDVGTVDQATAFVNVAMEAAQNGAIKIDNVSKEVFEKVKEQLGDSAFTTDFTK